MSPSGTGLPPEPTPAFGTGTRGATGRGVGPATDVAAQVTGPVITLVMSLTDPVWVRARPWMLAPASRVMLVEAMIVPTNEVVVSRMALLPTSQNTLHGGRR